MKATTKFSLARMACFFIITLCTAPTFAQVKPPAKKQVASVKQSAKPGAVKQLAGPVRVRINTDSGVIVVRLSDSTPLHRDNFVKLVKQGFYDSLLFHRVIPGFMIQGGDPGSKNAEAGTMLGGGGSDMTRIPAEFNPTLFHKKGSLAAARDNNPQKSSSGSQFYIVEGKIATDEQLNMLELQKGFKYTAAQRDIYKTIGGTPQLDQNYTVFGEVETGLDVISKIGSVIKDQNNRPMGNVRMKMEIVQ